MISCLATAALLVATAQHAPCVDAVAIAPPRHAAASAQALDDGVGAVFFTNDADVGTAEEVTPFGSCRTADVVQLSCGARADGARQRRWMALRKRAPASGNGRGRAVSRPV